MTKKVYMSDEDKMMANKDLKWSEPTAMTHKEVAQSLDLELSDFCDDGADLDDLMDMMEY
jgi:hypothetical protein